jgi:hypothetical protein
MSAVFNQPSIARRVAPVFQGFDGFLAFRRVPAGLRRIADDVLVGV